MKPRNWSAHLIRKLRGHAAVGVVASTLALAALLAGLIRIVRLRRPGHEELLELRRELSETLGEGVPAHESALDVLQNLQQRGALGRCMWGINEGAQCPKPAEWIVEATGVTIARTVLWMPACDAHASSLGHFATSRLLYRGRYRLIAPNKLHRSARKMRGTALASFPDAANVPESAPGMRTQVHGNDPVSVAFRVGRRKVVREIRPATPLSRELREGTAAEVATLGAAAQWGVPDFVFRASTQRKGGGVREIGDSLMLTQDLGVVIQVKRREGVHGDPDREARWIHKAIGKAERQAVGSVRTIKTTELHITNARGENITLGDDQRRWIGVIVIDHDGIPENIRPGLSGSSNCVVISRRDWEFLFERLKSVHGVVTYLLLMLDKLGPGFLNGEWERYFEWASIPMPPGGMIGDFLETKYFTDGVKTAANTLPLDDRSTDPEAQTFFAL